MGSVTLTDPVNGTITDATMIASNNAALKGAINGGLDNSNLATAAAIAASKIAGYPSDGTKALLGDGTWGTVASGGGGGGTSELDYAQITADVSVASTTEATPTTVITGNSITLDGATKVIVEFYMPSFDNANTGKVTHFCLWDGSTEIGIIGRMFNAAFNAPVNGLFYRYEFTPSAGSHQYSIRAFNASGTSIVKAGTATGAGVLMPAFMRVQSATAAGPQGIQGLPGAPGSTGSAPNIQSFTANGTWIKPSSCVAVQVIAIGQGGGGGGGGARAGTGTAAQGAAGGGGAARVERVIRGADLPSTVAVTVGAAANKGVGNTTTSGAVGTGGVSSLFGPYVMAGGGGAGGAGNASAGGGGGGGGGGAGADGTGVGGVGGGTAAAAVRVNGQGLSGGGGDSQDGAAGRTGGCAEWGGGGGSSTTTAAGGGNHQGGSSLSGGGGGGGAAWFTTGNTFPNPSNGGGSGTIAGGTGGAGGACANPPIAGTKGADGSSTVSGAGGGAGGGSTAVNVAGANGGDGGFPGGGGGGGGVGVGTGKGGDGGNGGGGLVVVISW